MLNKNSGILALLALVVAAVAGYLVYNLPASAPADHSHDSFAASAHSHDDAAMADHTHDGVADADHAHDGVATEDHGHEGFAAADHEHPKEEMAMPAPTYFDTGYFDSTGEGNPHIHEVFYQGQQFTAEQGVCFVAAVGGRFLGLEQSVDVYVEDGNWMVSLSGASVKARMRCIVF